MCCLHWCCQKGDTCGNLCPHNTRQKVGAQNIFLINCANKIEYILSISKTVFNRKFPGMLLVSFQIQCLREPILTPVRFPALANTAKGRNANRGSTSWSHCHDCCMGKIGQNYGNLRQPLEVAV